MAKLFTPLQLGNTRFKNRVFVSPMCQYSAGTDGRPNEWHLVHLGQFAIGGAALVMSEATAVAPEGRLSPGDTGLWDDDQVEPWRRITNFIHANGALAGVQLGHAGRKGSTSPPWHGETPIALEDGGWTTIAPSPKAFGSLPEPVALTVDGIAEVVARFEAATRRAADAGFDVVELHAAHGYLAHQFLSPISNERTDAYGGSFNGRVRFLLEVATAMRSAWPSDRAFFVRLSATDWVDGGWDLDDTIRAARLLREIGVDLIDCSSGGSVPRPGIPVGPGYQVPFAQAIRSEANIATGAVGRITEPKQAEAILTEGSADAVLLGKAFLREPHWPLRAAVELDADVAWPVQYETSHPRRNR